MADLSVIVSVLRLSTSVVNASLVWPSRASVVAIESEMTLSPTPPTWVIVAPGAMPPPVTAMPILRFGSVTVTVLLPLTAVALYRYGPSAVP